MVEKAARIECPNCSKIWNYTGENNITATCPDCRKIIKIEENRVERKKNDSD